MALPSSTESAAETAFQLNRTRVLDYLYFRDGRDNPDHPQHSLYTGLAQKYALSLGQACLDVLTDHWDEIGPELLAELNEQGDAPQPESECSPST